MQPSVEGSAERLLSSGFFSEIWKGTWRGHVVALKELNANADRAVRLLALPLFRSVHPQAHSVAQIFLREINTWRSLRSPYILPLLGASSATGPPPWFLVSPYSMFIASQGCNERSLADARLVANGDILKFLASDLGKRANKVSLVRQARGLF